MITISPDEARRIKAPLPLAEYLLAHPDERPREVAGRLGYAPRTIVHYRSRLIRAGYLYSQQGKNCAFQEPPPAMSLPITQHIGQAIRRIRQRKGIGQLALAVAIPCHVAVLSSIERGVVRITVERLFQIAQALDVSIVDLLDGVEGGGSL